MWMVMLYVAVVFVGLMLSVALFWLMTCKAWQADMTGDYMQALTRIAVAQAKGLEPWVLHPQAPARPDGVQGKGTF